jgi:O-antigen/teichoic acid export membrane protein
MINIKTTILNNKRYLLNVGTTFFSQFANAVTLIILTPLLSSYLGLSNFGTYGVIINVIAFSVILDFGLNIGLVRSFIHQSSSLKDLSNSIFIFFTSLLFLLFPIFLIFYFNYFQNTNLELFQIAGLTTVIVVQNILAGYFDALIQAQNKIYVSKIIRASKLLLELIFILIFIKSIHLIGLLTIMLIINVAYLLSLYLYLKKAIQFTINYNHFKLQVLLSHFKYSFWYFVSSLATVLVFNTQVLILNYYNGPIIAAKYLVVVRFFDIIRIAATNFTQVLFPKIIQIEYLGDWKLIKIMLFSVYKKISILIIFILLFLYFFGFQLFVYWSRLNDPTLSLLFNLYLIFTALIIFDNVSVIFLSALKLNKIPTLVSIGQGLLGILLSILLLYYIGYIGILAGFLTSFIFTNLFFNPYYLLKSVNKRLE